MNNKYTFSMVILALSFITVSCKNAPPVTSGIGTEQMSAHQQYQKYLQVHNKKLAEKLYISDIKSRKKNALLNINLTLTSTYEKSLQLQYQFQWFDQEGFAIEAGKSPWQPLELHGMQTATMDALAPSVQVDSFRVYVREVPEKFFKF